MDVPLPCRQGCGTSPETTNDSTSGDDSGSHSSESESEPESAAGSNANIADLSRPKRDILSKIPKDRKGRGRKRQRKSPERVRMNWKNPLIFTLIKEAQREVKRFNHTEAWSPSAIVKRCQAKSFILFGKLSSQVLGRWIDRSGPSPTWSADVLAEVELNGNTPHTMSTRVNILDNHPELKQKIIGQLQATRLSGTAVTVGTVHAFVTAHLQHQAPDILHSFRCSDSWARRFVLKELQWVMRKPTKASQKVPADADDQIELSFFRHVLTFRDAPIQHPAFRVNMDQTQVIYQMGGGLTFDVIGVSQVPVLGLEEKRAFTLVVAVSASGDLLPFQAIFQGKTNQSTPSQQAPRQDEANRQGFRFEYSGTRTYWSNIATMKAWVTKILEPYWCSKMVEYDIVSQECVLQLDVWKVHRSREFTGWMKQEYPWITLEFVPGGCTGLWQPCDVGIQRPLKLAIKRHQQADVVQETLTQLRNDIPPHSVKFDLTIGCLRDRAVNWLVSAHNEINKPDIVLQVFLSSDLSHT
jgi:hypothetical protein